MSIRKNTNPQPLDLPPEMQDLLLRNGMRGYLAGSSEGFTLIVQGHDSPLLTYPISEKQLRALTDWGTNSANKRCYNTFASIVAADFDLPKDFVHARNANGRVAMGLHGYRCRRVWTCGNAHASFSSHLPRLPRLDTPATRRLPPAAHRRRPLLSRCAYRTKPTGRTHEAGRIAVGRLRLLLQIQGRTTGATGTTGRRPAKPADGHHAAGQPSAQHGTGPYLQGTDKLSCLFFQREMAGMSCLPRPYRR